MTDKYKGSLIIVAAPSGGGKTSLVKQLLQQTTDIEVSISHTTRKKRPGEQEGVDYFFISEPQFVEMINAQQFVEYACVYKHYYGTSVAQIESRLAAGIDVVLDIDWQGAQQIKSLFADALSIFVIPPSLAELRQRLLNRGQDDEIIISERMRQAQAELNHYSEFDYLIVNDDFTKAATELHYIVLVNRLRIARQMQQQAKLLSFLLSSQ